MDTPLTLISPHQPFRFRCDADVPCFNECCRDLNQILTPYDLLRLKTHLGISSGELLDRYTLQHTGPETGLPVIVLRQEAADGFKCPFVGPQGCAVYENRPSSCRSYPVARIVRRSRGTGKFTEQFALIREPHCKGFQQDRSQTVLQWMEDQGLAPYNRMNDLMMDIIRLKNQRHPGPMSLREKHLFHLACYDLDGFREQVVEHGLLNTLSVAAHDIETALAEDERLLMLAFHWLRQALFGETDPA